MGAENPYPAVLASNDTFMRSDIQYDAAGRAAQTTDPRGLVTVRFFDALGRVTTLIEGAVGPNLPPATYQLTDYPLADDRNRTTQTAYDGSNHVVLVTALLPGGKKQQTAYVYGGNLGGFVYSNDLLHRIVFPNGTSGAPVESDSSSREAYTYNALGEMLTKTDRNQVRHTYTRDVSRSKF